MLQNNKFNLVLSIIIAIAIWAYVVLAIDPVGEEKISNIQVHITNVEMLTEQGLSINSNKKETVTVTVTGNRSELIDLNEENFTAVADVYGLSLGKHEVTVTVAAPLGIKVTDVKPANVTITVAELSEAEKSGMDTVGSESQVDEREK